MSIEGLAVTRQRRNLCRRLEKKTRPSGVNLRVRSANPNDRNQSDPCCHSALANRIDLWQTGDLSVTPRVRVGRETSVPRNKMFLFRSHTRTPTWSPPTTRKTIPTSLIPSSKSATHTTTISTSYSQIWTSLSITMNQ